MSDDHAAAAISAYGSRITRTPNIDRLASGEGGMRFENSFVTNSICTPSRAAILTGTYNHVNRVTTLHTHLDNRLPNVAKHLRTAGYQTAMVGKWHLGEGPAHEPTGFDYWKVLPGQGEYHDPVFHTTDGVVREQGYVTDIITDESIGFLERRDRPHLILSTMTTPTVPVPPPRRRCALPRTLPMTTSIWCSFPSRRGSGISTAPIARFRTPRTPLPRGCACATAAP